MDARSSKGSGHSTEVRIQLAVNGHVFSVAQLGPDFLVLRNPLDHPPTEGAITLSIDGDVKHWPVQLIDGIVTTQRKTRIVDVQPMATPG